MVSASCPVSLAEVLSAEAMLFRPTCASVDVRANALGEVQPLYQTLKQCNLATLCLSGEGIQSAAFSLGVIQRLAAERLAFQPPEGCDRKRLLS
jgi:hypothetical protein